MGKTENY